MHHHTCAFIPNVPRFFLDGRVADLLTQAIRLRGDDEVDTGKVKNYEIVWRLLLTRAGSVEHGCEADALPRMPSSVLTLQNPLYQCLRH